MPERTWEKDAHGKDLFCRRCGRTSSWASWTAEEKATGCPGPTPLGRVAPLSTRTGMSTRTRMSTAPQYSHWDGYYLYSEGVLRCLRVQRARARVCVGVRVCVSV